MYEPVTNKPGSRKTPRPSKRDRVSTQAARPASETAQTPATTPSPTPAATATATAIEAAPLEDLLFQLLNEIGIIDQLAQTAFQRRLPHGLTGAQFAVLNHCVRTGDGKTPARIADNLQVTRGTMTGTLARLAAKGFITFASDEQDGRSKRVLITPEGIAARRASIRSAAPVLTRMTRVTTRPAIEAVLAELVVLRRWLDANRLA